MSRLDYHSLRTLTLTDGTQEVFVDLICSRKHEAPDVIPFFELGLAREIVESDLLSVLNNLLCAKTDEVWVEGLRAGLGGVERGGLRHELVAVELGQAFHGSLALVTLFHYF